MTAYPWLKMWNEDPDNPNWPAAADMAASSPAVAWWAFSKMRSHANQNKNRGSITGLHPQVIASWCRVPVDEVKRIIQAFRELGILIGDRTVWGQGYGQDAWDTLSAFLASQPGMRKITCGTLACNEAMVRLAERSGMGLEGCRRAQELVEGEPVDVLYFARFVG